MEPNGFVEEGADEDISSDGHESSDAADEESSPRLDHEVRGGAHRDAAGQRRVLDVYHVELVMRRLRASGCVCAIGACHGGWG